MKELLNIYYAVSFERPFNILLLFILPKSLNELF